MVWAWVLNWATTEAAMDVGLGMELEMGLMVRFMLGLVMVDYDLGRRRMDAVLVYFGDVRDFAPNSHPPVFHYASTSMAFVSAPVPADWMSVTSTNG